jgi:hypothetical protein
VKIVKLAGFNEPGIKPAEIPVQKYSLVFEFFISNSRVQKPQVAAT